MISPDQHPDFRLCTLGITGLLSFLLLISPLSLFSQDNSPSSSDFNDNGVVDIPDFLLFVDVFGSKEGQERYESKYDLDGNDEIGIPDFLIFVDNFGKAVTRDEPTAAVPSNVVVENGDSKLMVRWDAVPDEEGKPPVSGYEVRHRERDAEDSDEWAVGEPTSSRLDTSVTITGLLNGQAYLGSVRTLVDGGGSEWSSPVLGIPVIPAAGPIFLGGGGGGGGGGTSPPPPPPPPPPVVTITAGTSPITEGAGAIFTITADKAPASNLVVSISVIETGNVISDTAPTSVTISSGSTEATLTVPTEDDAVVEDNSIIMATISTGTGYNVGATPSATVTVESDDVAPPPPVATITAGTSPITEGAGAIFTITADKAPASNLVVSVSVIETGNVIGGTAPTSVTISSGSTTATLTVPTEDDAVVEDNSTIMATISTGTGYNVGATPSATVIVESDDVAPPPTPEVTIAAGTSPVTEGTAATFTITASPAPASALTVNVTVTQTGNVISDTAPTSVTILSGSTTATLTVPTEDDTAFEDNSTITATISTGTGYSVGALSSATVIVESDDAATIVRTGAGCNDTGDCLKISTTSFTESGDRNWVDLHGIYGKYESPKAPPFPNPIRLTAYVNARPYEQTVTISFSGDTAVAWRGRAGDRIPLTGISYREEYIMPNCVSDGKSRQNYGFDCGENFVEQSFQIVILPGVTTGSITVDAGILNDNLAEDGWTINDGTAKSQRLPRWLW